MYTATIPRLMKEGNRQDLVVDIVRERKILWVRWYQVHSTRQFITMSEINRIVDIMNRAAKQI